VLAYASAGVRAIVEHQGLPCRPAQLAAARGPPQSGWYSGKIFDLTLPVDQVAEGYRAMDERRAIKVLLRP
jgi:hypothetical protein